MKNPILRFWRTDNPKKRVSEFSNHGLAAEICFGHKTKGVKNIELKVFTQDCRYVGHAIKQCQPDEKMSRRQLEVVTVDEWADGEYLAFVYINNRPCQFACIKLRYYDVLPCEAELMPTDDSTLLTDEIRRNTIDRPDNYVEDVKNDEEKDEFEAALDEFIADASGVITIHDDDSSYNTDTGNDNTADDDMVDNTADDCITDDCTAGGKDDEEALSAEEQLKNMVGLKRLKEEMADARMTALFNEKRRLLQLDKTPEHRYHMLFLGNPGTGKTTVARLVAKMYHNMGLLSKGHTVETERAKLVGEFIGQTEKNTMAAIKKARGGVLFIDEAYTLIYPSSDSKDFGKEVVNALLTVLAEPNPDLIVILAGYEDKMQAVMKHNPGLKERFPLVFHFDDYTAEELMEIARGVCNGNNYDLTPEADARLYRLIENAVKERDEYFGNGRWVHNLIHHGVIKNMARRVMSSAEMSSCDTTAGNSQDIKKLFSQIEESDVMETESGLVRKSVTMVRPLRIGFTA